MSKPEIFTTAYVVHKETLLTYGEDLSRHIADQLGRSIAEKIYQECEKGERIVSVEPYSQDIREINQVETRMNVKIQELVRCKDCKWFCEFCDKYKQESRKDGMCEHPKGQYTLDTTFDYYCADGERRSE